MGIRNITRVCFIVWGLWIPIFVSDVDHKSTSVQDYYWKKPVWQILVDSTNLVIINTKPSLMCLYSPHKIRFTWGKCILAFIGVFLHSGMDLTILLLSSSFFPPTLLKLKLDVISLDIVWVCTNLRQKLINNLNISYQVWNISFSVHCARRLDNSFALS